GRPAPLPISPTRPGRSRGAIRAELMIWRVHSRGSSSGPMRPSSSPRMARSSVNARATSIRAPKSAAAAVGSCSRVSVMVMFHVKLCARDHRVAIPALALGLRGEAAIGDDVMHQLALIRGHGGKCRRRRATLDPLDGPLDEAGEFGLARLTRSTDIEDEA